MPPTRFSERELDVMAVLWRLESGTVAEGRAYRYFPVVTPEQAGGPALQRLVDTIFQGSAEMLLARLVHTTDPSPEEIARMRELLDELEGEDA